MPGFSQGWLLFLAILLLLLRVQLTQALVRNENEIKSSVFLSPVFVMKPGSVVNKFYRDIDFPRGHIAIKSFDAEIIDEAGVSVPLHETYLHHWLMVRYYQRESVEYYGDQILQQPEFIFVKNTGVCGNLGQYFGLGSETRKTATDVPDPYAIEVGNPAEIPTGYVEKWLLNVHAIDTRGVEDRLGCTECRRNLYNVTVDEYGRPLRPDYKGGLGCCYDQTQCKDSAQRMIAGASAAVDNECIDTKRTSLTMPTGGYIIYGVAHQHSGGIGSTLYGEDGRVICSSMPTYGEGSEAGNEAGYIVGMSTCYPQPGSVKISSGETLILESNYNSTEMHTGVMGLFYILVADPPQKSQHFFRAPVQEEDELRMVLKNMKLSNFDRVLALLGVTMAIVGFAFRRWNQRDNGYETITV